MIVHWPYILVHSTRLECRAKHHHIKTCTKAYHPVAAPYMSPHIFAVRIRPLRTSFGAVVPRSFVIRTKLYAHSDQMHNNNWRKRYSSMCLICIYFPSPLAVAMHATTQVVVVFFLLRVIPLFSHTTNVGGTNKGGGPHRQIPPPPLQRVTADNENVTVRVDFPLLSRIFPARRRGSRSGVTD